MATLASDNVIQFPESGRMAASGNSLAEARDLMARRLREALRALIAGAKQELSRLGAESEDRDRRKFLYDTQDALMERGARLEALLATQWQREFDAAAGAAGSRARAGLISSNELQLLDQGELEEDIVLRSLAERLGERCADDLYAIGCRLGALAGRRAEEAGFNPAGPEVIFRALRGALREAGFATAERVALLRCLEQRAAADLAPVLGDLNGYLLRLGLLPNLKRSYGAGRPPAANPVAAAKTPPAAAPVARAEASGDVFALLQRLVAATPGRGGGGPAVPQEQVWASLDAMQRVAVATDVGGALLPTVNALHEFRASPVGRSLGEFDAVTVDIVAMLFDLIFNDKSIQEPIKSLVGRLQIPVLKVAMLDKSFFASSAHPARRLLDGISRAAVRWGRTVDQGDPLYRHVARIVEQVRAEFRQDTFLFETLCVELDAFVRTEEQAADVQAVRAAPLLAQREREEISAQVVHRVVAAWMAEPLPPVLSDLFHREWRALLVRHHLDGNDAGWGAAVRVAGDLIWSVQPKGDAAARKALVAKLPSLVRDLQLGLDLIAADADRRLAITDALFGLHAAVLRGTDVPEPSVQAAPATAAEQLTSRYLQDGDVVVESISAAPASAAGDAAAQEVDELKRGDWVEFNLAGLGAQRYRLSWVSPQRGVLLFTNPQSPRAVAVSPAALALQIGRGEAAVVRVEPIFDKAVSLALETLKAA